METDVYKIALERLCEREGGTEAVARAIESSSATIRQIINGTPLPSGRHRGVGPELRRRLSARYPDWVASISASGALDQAEPDVVIPQYDTGGSMGHCGVTLSDQPGVIKEWRVTREWLRLNVRQRISSPENLAIVTGFGPSMQPIFNPGDPLLVDAGIKRADADDVYFFRVGSDGFVKQLQRIPTPSGMILRAKSYNQLYDSFDIDPGMDFEVFARVIKVWHSEDL